MRSSVQVSEKPWEGFEKKKMLQELLSTDEIEFLSRMQYYLINGLLAQFDMMRELSIESRELMEYTHNHVRSIATNRAYGESSYPRDYTKNSEVRILINHYFWAKGDDLRQRAMPLQETFSRTKAEIRDWVTQDRLLLRFHARVDGVLDPNASPSTEEGRDSSRQSSFNDAYASALIDKAPFPLPWLRTAQKHHNFFSWVCIRADHIPLPVQDEVLNLFFSLLPIRCLTLPILRLLSYLCLRSPSTSLRDEVLQGLASRILPPYSQPFLRVIIPLIDTCLEDSPRLEKDVLHWIHEIFTHYREQDFPNPRIVD